MFDRYSCLLYDSILYDLKIHEKSRRRRLKNHEKVALTALYTSVDAILFFALCDVILCEM